MKIVNFVGTDGERFAVLLHGDGIPDYWANRWAVEHLRTNGQAANSISTKLRAVALLYRALPVASDLTPRLARGEWLTVAETDHLLQQLSRRAEAVRAYGDEVAPIAPKRERKVVSLEKMRSKLKARDDGEFVDTNTKFLRTLFICEYLGWRANQQIVALRGAKKAVLAEAVAQVDAYIDDHTAKINNDPRFTSPKGLDKAQQGFLLEAIKPDSPNNPWKKDRFIRVRNQLIVQLMLATGPRRGGVLGIQTGDFDPLTGRLQIVRRKDDPADPRPVQTGNKKGASLISLDYGLIQILKIYLILRHKLLVRKKRQTSYLIISSEGGALEQSSLNYIVRALRAIPSLEDIHPHLLRHTWASNFVEFAVERGEDINTIEEDLRWLGGWSQRSDMPSHYTSAYRHQSAEKRSLVLQEKLVPLANPRKPK
ncbi:MAG: site-specific integrase [Sterolibacterium sp.]